MPKIHVGTYGIYLMLLSNSLDFNYLYPTRLALTGPLFRLSLLKTTVVCGGFCYANMPYQRGVLAGWI